MVLTYCLELQVIPLVVTTERWKTGLAVALATLSGVLLSLLVMLLLARRRIKSHGNSNASGENSSSSKLGLIESIDEENNVKSNSDGEKFEAALKNFMEMRVLETVYEEDERSWASPPITNEVPDPILSASPVGSGKATPFKHLLESTPNRLVRKRTFKKMQKTTSREKLSHFFNELKKSAFYPISS
ncbi:hypothetical protein IFM89_023745 [Coptis chinensis]|uniref:Uncharacterized protein n=1 Tax=Coptis chinensis TaxID=261450 RepID=A0A835H0A4_9MAGN|nr:hypothetical protein IFM89_023745 [Coptis chinensis]